MSRALAPADARDAHDCASHLRRIPARYPPPHRRHNHDHRHARPLAKNRFHHATGALGRSARGCRAPAASGNDGPHRRAPAARNPAPRDSRIRRTRPWKPVSRRERVRSAIAARDRSALRECCFRLRERRLDPSSARPRATGFHAKQRSGRATASRPREQWTLGRGARRRRLPVSAARSSLALRSCWSSGGGACVLTTAIVACEQKAGAGSGDAPRVTSPAGGVVASLFGGVTLWIHTC